jgi:hypothetical protein
MNEPQAPKVTLPGTLYQRCGRWWWNVQLPGEGKAKSRPLKEKDAKAAVRDRAKAEELALALWEQSIREHATLQVEIESNQKIAALKAQFLEKVRHFTEVVETATAKAQTEAQARAEAEARLGQMTVPAAPANSVCDCCGANGMTAAELECIDSGQRLCPRCLAALRADVARLPASALPAVLTAQMQMPPGADPTAI